MDVLPELIFLNLFHAVAGERVYPRLDSILTDQLLCDPCESASVRDPCIKNLPSIPLLALAKKFLERVETCLRAGWSSVGIGPNNSFTAKGNRHRHAPAAWKTALG